MVNQNYDSILTATDTNLINTSTYYKVGKDLPDQGIPAAERPYSVAGDDIVVGGIFLMVLVMSIIMYRERSIIFSRVKEFFATKRSYSDANVNENNHEVYTVFFLTSISALSLSLIAFDYIDKKLGFEPVLGIPYWLFAVGYVLFVSFVYVKAWLYALVNWTFFDSKTGDKWMAGYMLLTALTSFLILPISLVALYVPNGAEIAKWGFAFLLFLYELLLLFKMFVNFESKNYGYLLIILYFCSVELIPAVVMSRTVQWVFDYIIVKILY